jgi:hypothetical protein
VLTMAAMYLLGSGHYGRVRRALGMEYMVGGKRREAEDPRPAGEIDTQLGGRRPWLLTLVGVGSLAVITVLMVYKPF